MGQHYVIPRRGRKPAKPESITSCASVMLQLCHNQILVVMDSGSALRAPRNDRMEKFASSIDRLTAMIGRAAAWLTVVIVVLQFALVVARYLFSLGSIWAGEAVIYAHAGL